MIIQQKEKKEFIKRLHFIKGQIEGIEKMMNDGREVKEVFDQLKAIEQGLHKAIYDVLDDQLKKQFAELLSERLALCPGDCDDAGRLQFLKREFPKLELQDLVKEYGWLSNSLASVQKSN